MKINSTTLKQKLTLLTASLLFTLLFLEISLRLGGWIYLSARDFRNQQALKTATDYRILCLGESMTEFGGDESFPSQLGRILNRSSKNKTFRVINKGIPGRDSSYILTNVEPWLKKFQPHFTVIMMGINDRPYVIPFKDQFISPSFTQIFKNFRIITLYKLLKQHLRAKIGEINDKNPVPTTSPAQNIKPVPLLTNKVEDPPQNIVTGHEFFIDEMRKAPLNYRQLYTMAVIYEGQKEFTKAAQIYQKLIDTNVHNTINQTLYKKLGLCFKNMGDYKSFAAIMPHVPYDGWDDDWIDYVCTNKAHVRQFEETIQTLIDDRPNNSAYYDLLGICYKKLQDEQQAQLSYRKAEELKANYFNPQTQSNYIKLLNLLFEGNHQPVIIGYPLRSLAPLKRMLRSEIDLNKVIFIENKNNFEEALTTVKFEELFEDRFAGDFGHCTAEGNRLTAHNIANTILHLTQSGRKE